MAVALPLFLGFLTASFGITPPGLINMTAARVSLEEGREQAFVFAAGATSVVLVQTYLGVVFARVINRNPGMQLILREVGLGIFLALTFFFLWRGRQPLAVHEHIRLHSRKSRFFYGMLLSALNFFPIPFYVFVSVTLAGYHYFSFDLPTVLLFVAGSGVGAFFGFWCYISFFKKMESRTVFIQRNMNFIIASVTGLVSLVTICEIADYYL
jgi:threonine/homoserine/homoserine lactone efflux protein